MKGGLYLIYTSLFTISVVSSCALFLLVVSEALQGEELGPALDLSGLHNVSKKVSAVSGNDVSSDSSVDVQDSVRTEDTKLPDSDVIVPDTLSLNSVTTDGLPSPGQPPILVSLADSAKLDLKGPDDFLYANDSDKHNDTTTFTLVDTNETIEEDPPPKEKAVETLVVKAKSMHETKISEDVFLTTPPPPTLDIEDESHLDHVATKTTEHIPVKPVTPQEDIPSFSEWAQKQLAEAEKKDTVLNLSTQTSQSSSNFSSKSTKIRSKNYASPACGAKVVAVNPEAGAASAILSPNRDEYMLNTCNSRIWFVVELCEPVQAQKIEIANFELFSSTPKEFSVYFSDRFPTREWASVGQFTAEELRDVQSFDLYPHLFGKFIKVEMHSHHGSEHYCPISLFKVYGTSEFEVLEKESAHASQIEDDEEDEIVDLPDLMSPEAEASKNLFGSARDAVMSIMKKAAQVLVKTEVPKNASNAQNDSSSDEMYKKCCSPSHIIVCDNCSETLYNEVFQLISCSSDKLTNLLRLVFLQDTLKCTGLCKPYGLDFKSTKTIEFSDERVAYINALFPSKYLAALCNMLAIKEKKVVLNTSFETDINGTSNYTTEDIITNLLVEANGDLKPIPTKDNSSKEESKPEITVQEQKPVEQPVMPTPDDTTKAEEAIEEKSETIQSSEQNKTQEDTIEPPSAPELETIPDVKPEEASKPEPTKNGKTDAEKAKETGGNGEDISEQLMGESDGFLAQPGFTAPHKESVFLRLSNRVKTLERNMSLSGQYLEELSRRYKKQVEEMQKTFEKTVLQMTEERRKSNDRELKYLEQMTQMQEQLAQMNSALKTLLEERDSWFGNVTFMKFIVFQSVLVTALLYYLSWRRGAVAPAPAVVAKKVKKKEKLRRKSVEGVSGHAGGAGGARRRRPSEEALHIARAAGEECGVAGAGGAAGGAVPPPAAPPLHEAEHAAPAGDPRHLAPPPPPPPRPPPPPPPKPRRLSSPAFLRTFSRGGGGGGGGSPLLGGSPNGSVYSQIDPRDHNTNKKRKSLKNIFRKVF